MCTPCRFDDKEYTNWIKCSRALTIFKDGLHDFIKTEVTSFHAHIQQTIVNIPCGSSAGSHCGFCTWRSIKLTEGQHGIWYINCKNKICDKWLSQILLKHNDPQNRNINWKNADISKWPTDGYEVAKVYMPKGQDKAKKLPDDFDAPAILSLLKFCAWFTQKIQTTSILSDQSEIYQKIKYFLANNPDIHDKNLSENIQALEKTVTALESKFEKKDKEIGRRITSMGANISGLKKGIKRKFKETEEKHQEIETKMTLMGKNIGGIKKGIKRIFKENEEKNQEIKTKITSMGKNISGIQKGIKRKFKETGEKHKEIKKKIILLGKNMKGIKKEVKRFTRK
ncbi:hypothetical protein CHS0354_040100 [Potamilus streckersoni]|uniref:Uncharacterized protein n=1 Tax=Potamilus streckersoni TaxID=2493646 RepID=A0AAE0SAF3_9BIVA|nr:hypothetical protein CHS0354_040100 [Potamilus streckersoni]